MATWPTECILCGSPPPLTGEHVFPDWYSRLHPERRYELEAIIGTRDPTYDDRDSLDLKPEVLCTNCNNRWGSTFENKTKPDIAPMSEGKQHTIGVTSARRLAAWACLKAMVAEHLVVEHRETMFFTEAERRYLRTKAHPPECVKGVWVGRYVGAKRDAAWVMDRRATFTHDSESLAFAVELYVQTLSIGQLVFQVFARHFLPIRLLEDHEGDITYTLPVAPGPWKASLVPIWPRVTIPQEWPPLMAFDDEGLTYLAGRWHEHAPDGDHVEPEPPGEAA